ncbi:CRISPR-associated helicase Cas3' [Paenibacillus cymbidii]|uniref:CRISPR-associated helicase Cas3' n=1 Tax=Paenibacillus cymbidii TaxID=1639034 RepID=UPI0010807A72|nr:CRISPR-associated helicase Cas3' [Paenibacillus cymbidii]
MSYIAHIRESDGKHQSVEEHLLGVQALAERYGEKLGVKHIAGLAGLLHDMGKFTHGFRDYIMAAVANPDAPPRRGSVDHSTAGGKLLYDWFHTDKATSSPTLFLVAEVVGNAIISHHSYLHDYLNAAQESPFLNRVRRPEDEPPEFNRSRSELLERVISEAELRRYVACAADEMKAYMGQTDAARLPAKLLFLNKFIFSALIDADRTNTRLFEENREEPADSYSDKRALFARFYERLMVRINAFPNAPHAVSINALRKEMSTQCERFAARPSGIYMLSIPTGGGKTLASLRYALSHAIQHNKSRIIYVVPFTTIIEQNAAEVRRILMDDEHILEHHSNVVDDADDEDEFEDGLVNKRQKLKLAKDNWEAPIIFTTMVQFLNVFYAKGTRNIRRLHNLCDAVIVFDEVQKVPVSCVSLFNQAVNFLKDDGNSSIVMCTATQPALDHVEQKLRVTPDGEMIADLDRVVEAFKRVDIIDRATGETFDSEKLTAFVKERLCEVRSVLVVLNTKAVVKRLYERLSDQDIPLYHLSTSMCAAHRNTILEKVRGHLDRREPVVCVSTQLIEAGVDVSFECVIRSLAGLDSIAQAAGRCNRHGEDAIRRVYVIDHEEENLKHLHEIRVGKTEARNILALMKRDNRLFGGSPLSVQAMKRYFQSFYTEMKSKLDYPLPELSTDMTMTKLLLAERKQNIFYVAYIETKKQDLPLFLVNSYRTAAEYFEAISDKTTAVLVPYGEGKDLIARLTGDETIEELSRLLRRAQQFSVNLFYHERALLERNGGLVSLLDGKIWALKESAYNEKYGLDLANDSQFDLSMY